MSETGYSTHQRETIAAMRRLGHEVMPVILGGTDASSVQEYHAEITEVSWKKKVFKSLIPLPLQNALKDLRLIRHDAKAAAQLKAAIEGFNPDLVYERNEYMQDKGLLLTRKMGIAHFLEVNSPCVEEMRQFEGPSWLHWLGLSKERRKVNATDRLFVVSSALQQHLIKEYQTKVSCHIIPNCIDPDKDKPDEKQVDEIRSEWHLKDKIVIGFVGSIFPYHGVDKLIAAFEMLQKKHENVFLMVVGDGGQKKQLESVAANCLKPDTYCFAGKIPHRLVMNYIELFDIAVMPDSNWYGSPIKIFEYGLLKKPMVVPDKLPLRDVVEENVDGLYSDGTASGLHEALEKALQNPELMKSCGDHFHQKIMEHYTWDKQAAEILSYA